MSANYVAVLWNKQKKKYDTWLWLGILIFIVLYSFMQRMLAPTITLETLIIRATALSAIILLHLILMIGPLCRIDERFLPLLYNRRHAGVTMFLLAAIHGIFSMVQFHSLGNKNPLVSLFVSNQAYGSISRFPFQTLGFFALLILLAMAVTSHDFWLKNLSPKIWKSLHMMVYLAYAMIICHIALGALQYEDHLYNWLILTTGFVLIAGLHIYAARITLNQRRGGNGNKDISNYYEIGMVSDIKENCAKTVIIEGENIAVFKYGNQLSAVNNLCKHQMGPLGEGRIIDGCITCPWHGYQYLPHNGQSPPPFKEKIKTYHLKIVDDKIWLNPKPNEEGTYVEPTIIRS